jgi:hypothetical protein
VVAGLSECNALSSQALASREHLVRLIDTYMEYLFQLRQQLDAKESEKLNKELTRAQLGHEKWLRERYAAHWAANETAPEVALPTTKDVFSRMFTFGGRKPKEPKKP